MSRPLIETLPFRMELSEMLLENPISKVREWAREQYGADFKERTLYLWRQGLQTGRIKVDVNELMYDPTHDLYLMKMKKIIKDKEDDITRMYEELKKFDGNEDTKNHRTKRGFIRQDITTAEKIVFQFYKDLYQLTRERGGGGGGVKKKGKVENKVAPEGFKKQGKTDREKLEEMGPEALEQMRSEINGIYREGGKENDDASSE